MEDASGTELDENISGKSSDDAYDDLEEGEWMQSNNMEKMMYETRRIDLG